MTVQPGSAYASATVTCLTQHKRYRDLLIYAVAAKMYGGAATAVVGQ